jgi:GT2 family glycosyltransferase
VTPIISVVMPAFNAERHILAALRSLADQTFSDFEILVIDDGSTDDTLSILRKFDDPRLRVDSLGSNRGLATARNVGAKMAAGKYIAWLDADDLALPNRLAIQKMYLDENQNVGVCGSWVRTFGSDRNTTWRYPRHPQYIRAHMLFDDPLATSAVMMRREILEDLPLAFDPSMPPAEDYDLWERASRNCLLSNIPRVLTAYRIHEFQTSTKLVNRQRDSVARIQRRQLLRLGLEADDSNWLLHQACGVNWGRGIDESHLAPLQSWLKRICEANDSAGVYDPSSLRAVLRYRYRLAKYEVTRSPLVRFQVRLHVAIH